MTVEVVTVEIGHLRYEQLFGPLRDDPGVLATMWQEAESRLNEVPGKRWTVAVAERDGRPAAAAAWAAALVVDGELRCCNNYERPGFRGRGLYEAAYRVRHDTIVARCGLPAVTYVFEQPLALHLADGWRVTDEGVSSEPEVPAHRWVELRRSRGLAL